MNLQQLMQNPQKAIINILGNRNPMASNLINMVSNNDAKGIEQFARNLAKEKGKDPDKMFNDIKSKFGM